MRIINYSIVLFSFIFALPAQGATIVASINGTPITDTDITARTKLMARQGQTSTDNRRVALQNIIDDNIKIEYARNFNAIPDDKTIDAELKKLNLSDMTVSEREMARNALRSEIAWQIIVGRTVLPTVSISAEDIAAERAGLAREHGLPIEMTLIRLTDIPSDIASKLTAPKSCDDALEMARALGGVPQKFTAVQYELSPEIRERVASLPLMRWSSHMDDSVLLVCSTRKTSEYKNLDDIIRQNATYKHAMMLANQQLKQVLKEFLAIWLKRVLKK